VSASPHQRPNQQIDQSMGAVLRLGVIVAASFVFLGGVIYLLRHSVPAVDYRVFQGEPSELRTIPGILREALAFHGRGLIQLGLLLLIATPIARVAFCVFAFLRQRDWTYVGITLLVLVLLCYSLLVGHF
jgi:uncharacterized membrane protein